MKWQKDTLSKNNTHFVIRMNMLPEVIWAAFFFALTLGHKKRWKRSTFFCPKSTMNLTYLCYGSAKICNHLALKNFFRPTTGKLVEAYYFF
jgi:hypothetical protein